jgi:hypothetical protein
MREEPSRHLRLPGAGVAELTFDNQLISVELYARLGMSPSINSTRSLEVNTPVAPGVVCTTSLRDVCPRMRNRRANLKSESNRREPDNSTS